MCLAAEPVRKEKGKEREKEGEKEYAKVKFKPCNGLKTEEKDLMRFSPKWESLPLSSRFGQRKFEDAKNINDELAKKYLLGVTS